MSMDFPCAWEISRSVSWEKHDSRCSYFQSNGGLLCDCYILTQHAEYKAAYPKISQEEKLFYALRWVVGATTKEELLNMIRVMEEILAINPGHQTAQISRNACQVLLECWPEEKGVEGDNKE